MKRSGIGAERLTIWSDPRQARRVAEQPFTRVERERQLFVQQPRISAQDLAGRGIAHGRSGAGEREHPEHGHRVVIFFRLID